jgi:AcrR family transcriptional regulator
MPRSGELTRQRLLDAALALFAEKGVATTSLREIRLQAGQRNTAALQYHYGDKDSLLRTLLQRELVWLIERRQALLEKATDLESTAAVLVLPYAELATGDDHQRCVIQFFSSFHDDVTHSLEEISDLLGWTVSAEVYSLLRPLLSDIPDPILRERFVLGANACMHVCAIRARQGRRQTVLAPQEFRDYIVQLFLGALAAKL